MFFFFNDTATTEIYTLSLHDALPISCGTGLARERRLLITGEPPKRAEDRERPNPNACTGLAEHLLPRRHGLIQSFPKKQKCRMRHRVGVTICADRQHQLQANP